MNVKEPKVRPNPCDKFASNDLILAAKKQEKTHRSLLQSPLPFVILIVDVNGPKKVRNI
jgi:hypothetical protein